MNHAIIAVMYGYPRILGIIPLILRNTLIYLFFVVGFLGFANNVNAATYYVDQNNVGCGDSNNGSEISPWCTITKAATTMIAGDTAIIKAGTYRESINPSNSGTDGSPITFQAADGETVIASGGKLKTGFTITPGKTYTYQVAETAANLNGYVWEDDTYTKYTSKTSIDQVEASVSSYYHDTVNQILYIHTSDGVDPSTHVIEAYAKSNISGSAKDYITFRGLTFKNAIYGIYHSGSHITVDSSVFYNIGYGIRIRETGSGEYATISDSIIHHNTSYGIQVEKSFATIDGNTVYSNNGKGIVVVATSTTISDNTIYSNTSQGISSTGSDIIISGNTVYNNGGSNILTTGTSYTISNNTIYGGSNGIEMLTGNGSTISGNTIRNNSASGIIIKQVSDLTVSNNTVYGNTSFGVRFLGNNADNTISSNLVYNNGEGIYTEDYYSAINTNNSIYNNVVYGNTGSGIAFRYQQGGLLANNTIYNNTGFGIAADYGDLEGSVIKNNIVANNVSYGASFNATGTFTVQNNNFYHNLSPTYVHQVVHLVVDSTNISLDPLFVNAAENDFTLQKNSPMIDAGATVATVSTDKDNNSRPSGGAYDIGAYESTAFFTRPIITTDGGNGPGGEFSTTASTVNLTGTTNASTAIIKVNGSTDGVTYTSGQTSWSYTGDISSGSNIFQVTATDGSSNESGYDEIVVVKPIANKFLAFGDSITVGNNSESDNGYPVPLQNSLDTYYGVSTTVVNSGLGGEATPSAVLRLRNVIKAEAPQGVFIMEGTNNTGSDTAYWTKNKDNLQNMLQYIKSMGATPILGIITPDPLPEGSEAEVNGLNNLLRPMALEEDVVVADHWTTFYEYPNYSSTIITDGTHPNDAGYAIMATNWYNAWVNGKKLHLGENRLSTNYSMEFDNSELTSIQASTTSLTPITVTADEESQTYAKVRSDDTSNLSLTFGNLTAGQNYYVYLTIDSGSRSLITTALPNSNSEISVLYDDVQADITIEIQRDTTSPTLPSVTHSSSGSTAQSRVNNLISLGFLDEAQKIANQYNIAIPQIITPSLIKSSTFSRDLKLGMSGEDVKKLQQLLNKQGFTISSTGLGSLGNETDFFGSLTKQALIRFQSFHNITPSIGYFGPITRSYVNGTQASTTISTTTFPFTRNLGVGSTGEDVKQLQVFLNTHGYTISTTGPGSLGNETTIFGQATQSALIRFQIANRITPAVGYFGPVTRGVVTTIAF